MVMQVENNIHYLFLDKDLIFENSIGEHLRVFADERMIYSIFHNLLHNAAKFSFRNGTITVTSETGKGTKFTIIQPVG